jgi:hypothetical protein
LKNVDFGTVFLAGGTSTPTTGKYAFKISFSQPEKFDYTFNYDVTQRLVPVPGALLLLASALAGLGAVGWRQRRSSFTNR